MKKIIETQTESETEARKVDILHATIAIEKHCKQVLMKSAWS